MDGAAGQSPTLQNAHPDAGLSVEVAWLAPGWADAPLDATRLEQAATAAFQAVAAGLGAEMALILADDAHVRTLNRTWRGQDKATNVLAFPTGERAQAGGPDALLGDVVLALETVAREAADSGIPLQQHACHLAVHGLLHLLGYDHESDRAAVRMEALETAILTGLGWPDPHAEPAREHALEQ